MNTENFTPFSPEHRAAVQKIMLKFPAAIRTRALQLCFQEAVKRIAWVDPGWELGGAVVGGQVYTQSILFRKVRGVMQVAEVSCSCPYGSMCKHAMAVLIMAQQEGTDVRVSGSRPAGGQEAKEETGPAFLADFAARIGAGSVSSMDREAARKIEEWYTRGVNRVQASQLRSLAGLPGVYGSWQSVQLWPESRPPRNAEEAWLCVALALRRNVGGKKLTGLFGETPWKETEALEELWRRDEEVQLWKAELEGLASLPEPKGTGPKFRLRLADGGGVIECCQREGGKFLPVKPTPLRKWAEAAADFAWDEEDEEDLDETALKFLRAACPDTYRATANLTGDALTDALNQLLRLSGMEETIVSEDGTPIARCAAPLQWKLTEAEDDDGNYELKLCGEDGEVPGPVLAVLAGRPSLLVTPTVVYPFTGRMPRRAGPVASFRVPAAALESENGLRLLRALQLPLPGRITGRQHVVPVKVEVTCGIGRPSYALNDYFYVTATAEAPGYRAPERWIGSRWEGVYQRAALPQTAVPAGHVLLLDHSAQEAASRWLQTFPDMAVVYDSLRGPGMECRLAGAKLREFPELFIDLMSRRPDNVDVRLDPELASLLKEPVSGTVSLDAEESGIDWFDLKLSISVTDLELTPAEIELLLKARGGWVRLTGKGWRRLDFGISEEEETQLADLGLGMNDLSSGEAHRLHVLQLAGEGAARLLPPERAQQVKRRLSELKTRVTPDVPAAITAGLRPYQCDGYHFLAYLSENRFGGILADDMGLGKTVQTLAWLAWLRQDGKLGGDPVLVVCPKSVQDNWRAEVAKFYPTLRVGVWSSATAADLAEALTPPKGKRKKPVLLDDVIVINYSQLRLNEATFCGRKWSAVILDEAQYIKNPASRTAKAACSLDAPHRLALSGTPIENRLLDLWSIMAFAMPGVLGNRTSFAKNFNGKDDPLARRRLAARVRPFVLRRTKSEVARDLPDRIEEEILCDLEGPQATLYKAELKRARSVLLNVKTSRELDKMRFNILTSLLRLRQICCHPALVGGSPGADSAKLSALMDLLEPLMEEGHKVLVFSQFVGMLEIIGQEIARREWPSLMLTGQTEDRGTLVRTFQETEGSMTFLISLKAGGSGLNLTAASYVVLFDPWWNPAVENQAIDRTHRIGQTSTVIAYRILVKETIEEKIRHLQKQKTALASDILGEESFAKALTMDDFQFLLGEGE